MSISAQTNCGGSWRPIIICEFLQSLAHANRAPHIRRS